jgi:hypothetical protein
MVKDAAAEQTRTAAEPLIKREVATQVKMRVDAERPVIVATVTQQTKEAVKQMQPQIDLQVKDSVEAIVQRQVKPVAQEMSKLQADAGLQRLIIRMGNDDAHAYDELVALRDHTSDPETRTLIASAVGAVEMQQETGVHVGWAFYTPMSEEQLLEALSRPNPHDRLAALNGLSANAKLLPRLIDVINNDPSLTVRCQAARMFNGVTKQQFTCLNKPAQLKWWEANKQNFGQTQ